MLKQRVKRGRVTSEINITPFTDVVLVLLIIFMITTPLIMQQNGAAGAKAGSADEGGFNVQLPQAKTADLTSHDNHLVVAILKDGRIVVDGEALSEDYFMSKLAEVKKLSPDTLVIIQADLAINHGRVVEVMDMVSQAGLKRLAIATEEK
jgi:biopolymer transport protein ExbD